MRFDARPDPEVRRDEVVLVASRAGSGDDMGLPVWVRILMTIAALAGGIALIVGLGPWWDMGRPVWALGAVLLVIYAGFGGVLVARLWAPDTFGRREEHVVVLDRRTMDEVESRQRSLIIHDEPGR
jgi:hypothetical protein